MNGNIKVIVFVIILMIFLPDCKKNTTSSNPNCLVVNVIRQKRKIVFSYTNTAILKEIDDYSDSTSVLSLNRNLITFNSLGQVSGVVEEHETGIRDSISFEYSGSSKVIERKYLETNSGMQIEYTRNYIFNSSGLITSDSIYGEIPVRKSLILSRYTKYSYDASNNLSSIAGYQTDGTQIYNVAYEYSSSPIKNTSYNIARFTFLDNYSQEVQYVFPQMNYLPSQITNTVNGVSTPVLYTYDLDSNGKAVADYATTPGCQSCSTTTRYTYTCY